VAVYELAFGPHDLARVRFATSPLWETTHAVRCLVDVRQRGYHLPWLESVRLALADLDVAPLLALVTVRGYVPDLLAPAPATNGVSAEEQLRELRATPLARVRQELARAVAERGGQPVPAELAQLAQHPRRARDLLADVVEACWHRLVEPYWPRIKALLDADVTHHSALLAAGGLDRMLPALSPRLHWATGGTGGRLRVEGGGPRLQRVRLGGAGLVLQPSAFSWPDTLVVTDRPYQPTLVYPARGIAELWQPVHTPSFAALADLLGRSRATVLASLREPAATTTLAHRHRLAAATVSQHLSALRAAGLVSRTRHGRVVLYRTTALGEALLAGQLPAARPSERAHTGQTPTTSMV
jgi:DNA-binding transcriptional ArsR family regulator